MHAHPPTSPREYVTRFLLERYDKPSRVSEIAGAIGIEIIEGIRPPGAHLVSGPIAKAFETSRTPVREALMLLEKEGLVELPPRKRPYVSRPDIIEIRENYDIRATLMGIVMARVATDATPDEIGELRALFATMEREGRGGNAEAYFWANVAFHDRATEIARNGLLGRILGNLFLRALRFRHLGLTLPGRRERSIEDHARLMRALEERDPDLAAALIRSVIRTALIAIEQHRSRIT